jgi:hypothetical protein
MYHARELAGDGKAKPRAAGLSFLRIGNELRVKIL